jgi:DNA-binding LacI/PurR family transcriptional regulator
MGLRAVELLNRRLHDPKGGPVEISIPVHVILRQTTVLRLPGE